MGEPRLVTGRHRVSDPAEIRSLPQPPRPTFFFLSFSTHGYGHLARSHKIAGAFVERAPFDAFVISSHPDFSTGGEVPRVHEISFPSSVSVSAAEFPHDLAIPGLAGPRPDDPVAELPAFRGRLLLDLLRRLRPRGILIDHFPFPPRKAAPACEEALAWLRDQLPTALVCAGFRGVLARSYTAEEQRRVRELLERYVDVFFVYLDAREERDFVDAYPFLRPLGSRTRFVGYVCPPRHGRRPRAGRVLATFGAGVDAYLRIRLVCEAFLVFARTHPEHTLAVVTGGRLPEAEYREIARCYDGARRIRVTRFLPGLPRFLGEYELVIAMAGYNTLTELYQSSARSIILPRGAMNEQMAQALKFERYGAVDRVLDAGTTSADALASIMEEILISPPPARHDIDVDGAMATARILGEELDRRTRVEGGRDGDG